MLPSIKNDLMYRKTDNVSFFYTELNLERQQEIGSCHLAI
ncbi:hypothetical protein SAMN05443529_11483 [Desulfosporosinus hippei DSM 8344]|uniref:Uncharacterized protein n=1 Tax=Desulfosporosinus hippei DSM 8344 TaxID=1121419 RepID=A0A1G8D1B7_9FIRM|nr:hypothetical protein SAMN05443529_11483 [Desulfosporosinus hippei DSM 8344]